MEWNSAWTAPAIFVGIALLLILLVLAAKNNRGGHHHVNSNKERNFGRHDNIDRRDNTTLVYKNRRSAEDQRGGMQVARRQPSIPNIYDRNEAMKIFGRPQAGRTLKDSMTNKDPLKVIFGSPDRTFNDQMRDTSSLKMIFGSQTRKVESNVEIKEDE